MPLGLSPYVTSCAQDAWSSRRMENDRPSPLRINKQRGSTRLPGEKRHQEHVSSQSQNAAPPLQNQSASRLNITKRRSMWALTTPTSLITENEQRVDFPQRPFSVDPTMAMATPSADCHNGKDNKTRPRTAEEAEQMLREASRTYSGTSDNSNSWNSFVSGGFSVRKSSGTQSSASVVRNVSSSTDGPSCILSMDSILPHVLSPHISIHTDSHSRYFGQDYIWAAIEVSGILSHAYSADGSGSKPTQPKEQEHHLDLFFKHGCLHDLNVEILPVENTTVLQVFHEQSFPTILYAGSRMLLLAQILVNSKMVPRTVSGRHRRQNSDELMADLESQLGDSQMPYMKVRITYSHSAFSDYFGHEILVGVSQRCTRLETTAVGALKQHNVSSAWSPRPMYSTESLKCLLKRHWKDDVVTDWLERIESCRNGVVQETTQHHTSLTTLTRASRPRTPTRRPVMSMEEMCQPTAESCLSEPQNHAIAHDHESVKRGARQDQAMAALRGRRSWSRNTSGTTCTSGSLRKKKSFAAGIWRTLTPSVNSPGNGGDGAGAGALPGAWNWNSWF